MFLKRKVQEIFKKTAQNLFKLFHGKIKHVNDDNLISKLEKKKLITYNQPRSTKKIISHT